MISKFQVGLKSLLRQGLSEPEFYGDLMYRLKKIVGSNNFSAQLIEMISHDIKIGYNINVLQQAASLSIDVMVGGLCFGCCQAYWSLPVKGCLEIPMNTNCANLGADIYNVFNETDF